MYLNIALKMDNSEDTQIVQAPKATLEEESSVSTVHDTLAFTVCNEILSAPDSFQTKTLIKV